MARLPCLLSEALPRPAPAITELSLYLIWMTNLLAVALGAFSAFRAVVRSASRDLTDAAKIDGCGYWQIYWQVKLPILRPALGLIALFIVFFAIGDAVAPLLEMGGQVSPPLSPALYTLKMTAQGVSIGAGIFGLAMAGSLFLIPPVVAMFASPTAKRQRT